MAAWTARLAGRTEPFFPSVKDTIEECPEGAGSCCLSVMAAPHFCLQWQLIIKAKRKGVRKWIVYQFGQFFSQLPKWKGSVFRCTVVCVL